MNDYIMLKLGSRILTPDGLYGTIECIRAHSIVVRFSNGWFKSYWIGEKLQK